MIASKYPFWLILLLTLVSCRPEEANQFIAGPGEIEKYLHVPSPDWEDQIIYFILTDRFMDGDTTNNDQDAGEYNKGHGGYWNGGDFRGITQKIGYIKELGATGIWITPPVANQWVNPQKTGTGYHGYWASSFVEVDKHYGTLDNYRQLSASLHKNSMYLIQDVVCNHLGDFYTYTGPYDPDDVTKNFKVHDVPQPTQSPFEYNDACIPEHREMAIYHFAPNFHDHSDTIKKRQYQYADLDDLNTANPVVRDVLRSSYNYWIKEVGVDGFRFDTPHMVEHEFWHDFIHSDDTTSPGVEKFARMMGKEHFLTFGETAVQTLPYDDGGPTEAARYLGTPEKPEMVSVLNFPLSSAIGRVFKQMKPTNLMTYRLESLEKLFPHPEWLMNFIDNHDGARFLSNSTHSSFRQALLFMMTIPGVPIIYYGTEQELLGMRQAMFKGGSGSPDQDHFTTDNESFRFMQELIRIRKENDVLRHGKLEVLRDDPGGPGIFIYRMQGNGQYALVLLNTSEREKLADHVETGLEPGMVLESLYSLNGEEANYIVDHEGGLSVVLKPKEGMILVPGDQAEPPKAEGEIYIHPLTVPVITAEQVALKGESNGIKNISVAIDGDLARAIQAETGPDGDWAAEIPLNSLVNARHRIIAFSPDDEMNKTIITDHIELELELPAILCAEIQDVLGDDYGPEGRYIYPTNPSYRRQMDIEGVRAYKLGTGMKVEITMGEITGIWLPANGFDHVLINIYIDLPDRTGVRVLSRQNASFPENGHWDYLVSAAGFGNAVFSSEGASANKMGSITGPTASITVDPDQRKITFMIAPESMGYPEDLSGSKLYITTWDGGPGSYRNIAPEAQEWAFGGGSNSDPKIMDDTGVIILE